MNVLLINPEWKGRVGRDRRFNRPWPPLSLLITAGLFRQAGHTSRIFDFRAGARLDQDFDASVRQADLILLTSSPLDRWQCPNLDLDSFFDFARRLPGEKLILTGAHGTVYPEWMLQQTGARRLIRGEPEGPLREFIERGDFDSIDGFSFRDGKDIRHNPAGSPVDLDSLPPPAYDLIRPEAYFYELLGTRLALLETGRGCPFRCPFCFQAMYGSPVRTKGVERVLDEVRRVSERGFNNLYFIDLEFVLKRERALELCRGLADLNRPPDWACQTRLDSLDEEILVSMSRSGCRLIHIGIETGTDRFREWIAKPLNVQKAKDRLHTARTLGIASACFYLIGFPGETAVERKATLDLALRLDSTYASFHLLTPYPTTEYSKKHVPEAPGFPSCLPGIDKSEASRWTKRALRRYYLRPVQIWNIFRLHTRQGGLFKKLRLLKEFLC